MERVRLTVNVVAEQQLEFDDVVNKLNNAWVLEIFRLASLARDLVLMTHEPHDFFLSARQSSNQDLSQVNFRCFRDLKNWLTWNFGPIRPGVSLSKL